MAGVLGSPLDLGDGSPLDIRSYLLGQRTALEYAFAEALPQRTVLGSLQASVRALQESLQEEAGARHNLQSAAATVAALQAAGERRLEAVESTRLPEVERSLAATREALAALTARVNGTPTSLLSAFRSAFLALLASHGGLGGLLERLAGAVLREPAPTPSRDALGPLLLLCLGEGAWQLLHRSRRPLSKPLRDASRPAARAIGSLRALAWAAALVMAAGGAKRAAHSASKTLVEKAAAARNAVLGAPATLEPGAEDNTNENK